MALFMDYWNSIDIGRPELNHSQGFFSEFNAKFFKILLLLNKIISKILF